MAKIFPVPPLLSACAFAWPFVAFATSTSNSINFARYIDPTRTDDIDAWRVKFIACATMIAISALHYRLADMGLLVNKALAAFKVGFLLVLVAAGFIRTLIGSRSGELGGLHDFPKTKGEVSATNVSLALLQVLYSYQGWENANYVTAEISDNKDERRRILKRGALTAVAIVNTLYILFNLFLSLVLDYDAVIGKDQNVTSRFALKIFQGDSRVTELAVYALIGLAALGNLTGVTFVNARVDRDIAKYHIIPFYSFFSKSSKYGQNVGDGLGTPTGGLILHCLVTCITVSATSLAMDVNGNVGFHFHSYYTYAHSIVCLVLGIGILFLEKRMRQYQTKDADPVRSNDEAEWSYQIMRKRWIRHLVAAFFTVVNLFLLVLPFLRPPGEKARTWITPVVVLSVYFAGAVVAFYILCFIKDVQFRASKGNGHDEAHPFYDYNQRKWIITYYSWSRKGEAWKKYFQPLDTRTIYDRLTTNKEAVEAENLRNRFRQQRT